MRWAAAGDSARASRTLKYSPRYVTTSVSSPMRRSMVRATGRAAQPASWPWVSATARLTPARRSAGVIRPSGAAAPNRTVSQSCSQAMAAARRETDGTGSMSDVGWRITGNGCLASNSAAPSQAGAYTTTVPGGSRVASPCTNDWIPP